VTHSFLLQPGKWSVDGHYLTRGEQDFSLKGLITISWQREYWFKMKTQLSITKSDSLEILCQCKGHLDNQRKSYTYVLQHNILGNIEGEGWLGFDSIIQHYWVVGATQRRLGFETFYCLSENTYHFTSVYLESHNLKNTMEATLKQLT
jgi:hypothetical protein